MAGGLDTYNLLVPKGQCDSEDGYAAYAESRGNAVPLSKLTSVYTSGQACSEFGVHSDFSLLADLYNQTVFFRKHRDAMGASYTTRQLEQRESIRAQFNAIRACKGRSI
jgi:hypothetical protein